MLRRTVAACALALLQSLFTASLCAAQQGSVPVAPVASKAQKPAERDEQEQVKVYTEEVLLPVVAYDDGGRFDPSLEADDVLVLEDNIPQQVRSVRRLPAHILLVLDIGSQITALTRSSETTREVALRLADIFAGDEIAIVQNSNRVELLLDWTTEADAVAHTLKTKFLTARRSRLSACLAMAADELKGKPAGNTHVIVLTDGPESGVSGEDYALAVRRLAATQASLHVITYSTITRQAVKQRNSTFGHLPVIDLDFEMKRWFKKYAEEIRQSEQRLSVLATETGGRLFLPESTKEAMAQADQVGQDIRSQYVVTYQPKRSFADTPASARRMIRVLPRRSGLHLQSLRSSITPLSR